ncbi:MAG: hypothetical protein ACI85F_000259 [Bacteroidia bacterium]
MTRMIKQEGYAAFNPAYVIRWFCLSLTLIVCVGMQYSSAQSLSDGLVFLYNFSGEAVDSSVNQMDGIVNGVVLTEDRFGNPNPAYFFDGVNDNIEIPFNSEMRIDPPVSFSFFAKLESIGQADMKFFKTDYNPFDYNGFWMDGSGNGNGGVQLHWGGGLGSTGQENRRSKFSDSTVTTGVWHHIAGVIRGVDDMDIYIDCQDAAGIYSGNGPLMVSHTTSGGKIGEAPMASTHSINYYHGALDQFAMWNRGLSFGEISKICENDLEPVLPSSIPYHKTKNKFSITYSNAGRSINIACNDNSSRNYKAVLFNVDGKEVKVTGLFKSDKTLDVSRFSNGLYLLKLVSRDYVEIHKVIVSW